MFLLNYSLPPYDRSETNGFRTVQYLDSGPTEQQLAAYRPRERNLDELEPYSDKEYAALITQYDFLKGLNDRYLEKHRLNEMRWFVLPETLTVRDFLSVDVAALQFILESNEPTLLNGLLICQRRYEVVLEVLTRRNEAKALADERLAALEATEVKPPETEDELDQALGRKLASILQSTTDGLYSSLDDALLTNVQVAGHLRNFLKKNYPKRKVLAQVYTPDNEANAPDTNSTAGEIVDES